MKIELKNTDFKEFYEWLESVQNVTRPLVERIVGQLKPQYDKAFLKYQDEEQKFEVGDKVKFKNGKEDTDGRIIAVSRLSSGKIRYCIQYYYIGDYDDDGNTPIYFQTRKYLTEKNIRKI